MRAACQWEADSESAFQRVIEFAAGGVHGVNEPADGGAGDSKFPDSYKEAS